MSVLWRLCVAVAAVLAAAWLAAGLVRPVEFLDAEPGPPDGPVPRPHTTSAPARYAYTPPCDDECPPRVLVTVTGERWRLDGAGPDDPFTLSADGTRAAHLKDGRFVVRDLTTGKVTELPFTTGVPHLSPDGRHLLIDEGRRRTLVDVASGTAARLPEGGPAGWTSHGLALVLERPSGDRPGHVTEAAYTIHGTDGRVVRRFTLPGSLGGGRLSPSARTLATLAVEHRADAVVTTGVVLTDPRTGRTLRTVAPKLPDGRRIVRILRWENEEALLVRSENRYKQDSYHVVDVATGAARDALSEFPIAQPAVVIGAVR